MLAAFFAKGSSFPLGEINNFIVENIPFGHMIRNPDIKFAALISALYFVGIAILPKFNQKIMAVLVGVFLCINLYNIYFNGAISAQQGGHLATSYIYADDYEEVASLINQKKNSLMLSPFEKCSGEYYQGKFYTCNDLLISNLERQVIQKNSESFGDLLARYQLFSTFIYFNKNKTTYRKELETFENLKMFSSYKIVYDSNNYTLYFRESEFPSCDDTYQYACIRNTYGYVYSIPWFYFDYLTNKSAYVIENDLVQTNQKLVIHKNLWPIVLEWTYMLSLVFNLILLYRNARVRA
jgi:hypothetical protein